MVRECKAGFAQAVISVHLDTAGVPLELDPETGTIYSADAQRSEAGWRISTSLPPLGSRLYVLPKKAGADAFPRRPRLTPVSLTPLAPASWRVSLSADNVLVLDRAAFRIGDGEWQDREEILRIGALVRKACDTPRHGGKKPGKAAATTAVALAYSFEVAQIPSGAMHLAVERPELFTIAVNGVPLDMDSECGWWCDRSLRKIPFRPSLLRTGLNEVTMTCAYGAGHSGLETAYLLGNFSVNLKNGMKDAEIGAPVSTLRCGDWVEQGLPFYSGHVAYLETIHPELKPGERLFVEVPAYRGVAVRIGVNGRDAGIIAWEPNELDITDLVGDGPAQLMLEVIGHRRNSHGPLHNSVLSPTWTGPDQFASTGNAWVDHYQVVACGLMEPPRLVVKNCCDRVAQDRT
ncbi:MAG: hypothetical protein E4H17_02210 [Gemmatimonadales bacterium]|nr:MAG: hypothetical protein E4H17_02210 [Gemmatimonadales bacterium]